MAFSALILAGSRGPHDAVATAAGVSDKALADVAGETMLARVAAALRAAGATRLFVSANSPAVIAAAEALGAIPFPAATGPSGSTRDALRIAGTPLLVTTADHALLRPEWVGDFIAALPQADVVALLAERAAVERDAPPSRRTWLRFGDGRWSGCNLFWLATPRADAALELWEAVERDRKRPWRIVARLGPGLLFRYVSGRLTLAAAVAALGRRAGVTARVVAAGNGLAAVDVDTPADLALVRRLIAGSASAS